MKNCGEYAIDDGVVIVKAVIKDAYIELERVAIQLVNVSVSVKGVVTEQWDNPDDPPEDLAMLDWHVGFSGKAVQVYIRMTLG